MQKIHAARLAGLLTMLCLLPGAEAADRPELPLTLAVHPYLPSSELLARFDPLADYLGAELAREVRVSVSPDYQQHINSLGTGRTDIAFMEPVSYTTLGALPAEEALLARLETGGTPTFRGTIVARQGGSFRKLDDLRFARLAFGDPDSTMGHRLPLLLLARAGIGLNDLVEYEFLGSHNNVALAVLSGAFDAGAIKEEVFEAYSERGLKALAYTPAISEHLFVAGPLVPKHTVVALRTSLLNLANSPAGPSILDRIKKGTTKLVPVTNADYDDLRQYLQEVEGSP